MTPSPRALREIMRVNQKVLLFVAQHPELFAAKLAKHGVVLQPVRSVAEQVTERITA